VSATLERRYLDALKKLRARVDTLEEMARWKEDLTSRLWREEVIMRIGGKALCNADELAAEIEVFMEIGRRIREIEEK
jgi:hypothetical protein